MLMRDEEDNGIESDEIVSGLKEVTRSDTASSVGSNRHKRGRQGSKRARMVVNKTSSTLLWTEIESDEDFDSLRFNFTGEAQGPSQTLPPDVFSKCFDDDMISLLVEEINR